MVLFKCGALIGKKSMCLLTVLMIIIREVLQTLTVVWIFLFWVIEIHWRSLNALNVYSVDSRLPKQVCCLLHRTPSSSTRPESVSKPVSTPVYAAKGETCLIWTATTNIRPPILDTRGRLADPIATAAEVTAAPTVSGWRNTCLSMGMKISHAHWILVDCLFFSFFLQCFYVYVVFCWLRWGRWRDILAHARCKRRLSERDVETICRVILVFCLMHYRGDENIKSFIWELITPPENGREPQTLLNHSGRKRHIHTYICFFYFLFSDKILI